MAAAGVLIACAVVPTVIAGIGFHAMRRRPADVEGPPPRTHLAEPRAPKKPAAKPRRLAAPPSLSSATFINDDLYSRDPRAMGSLDQPLEFTGQRTDQAGRTYNTYQNAPPPPTGDYAHLGGARQLSRLESDAHPVRQERTEMLPMFNDMQATAQRFDGGEVPDRVRSTMHEMGTHRTFREGGMDDVQPGRLEDSFDRTPHAVGAGYHGYVPTDATRSLQRLAVDRYAMRPWAASRRRVVRARGRPHRRRHGLRRPHQHDAVRHRRADRPPERRRPGPRGGPPRADGGRPEPQPGAAQRPALGAPVRRRPHHRPPHPPRPPAERLHGARRPQRRRHRRGTGRPRPPGPPHLRRQRARGPAGRRGRPARGGSGRPEAPGQQAQAPPPCGAGGADDGHRPQHPAAGYAPGPPRGRPSRRHPARHGAGPGHGRGRPRAEADPAAPEPVRLLAAGQDRGAGEAGRCPGRGTWVRRADAPRDERGAARTGDERPGRPVRSIRSAAPSPRECPGSARRPTSSRRWLPGAGRDGTITDRREHLADNARADPTNEASAVRPRATVNRTGGATGLDHHLPGGVPENATDRVGGATHNSGGRKRQAFRDLPQRGAVRPTTDEPELAFTLKAEQRLALPMAADVPPAATERLAAEMSSRREYI